MDRKATEHERPVVTSATSQIVRGEEYQAGANGRVARVRVDDPALALELAAYLRDRGFLIAAVGRGELRVDLLNHVSERYDRARVQAVVAEWTSLHPQGLSDGAVEIV